MKSIRLIQFTDTHLFGDTTASLRGVACLPALRAAMADAQSRTREVDAVLITGDLVQDDPAGYPLVREAFGRSKVPVLCLAGNHDLPDQMRSELADAPFQVGGELELGRWIVIALHTWKPHSASGRIGPEQMNRLRQTLNSHRNHHVLICLHHHPIEMHSRWLDQVGLDDADEFMNIVRTNSNVRGVLWGHVHQSLDSFMYGMRFMATPATCAQFVPHSDDFAIDDRPPGYRLLELMPDGSIATEVVWLEQYAQRVVA